MFDLICKAFAFGGSFTGGLVLVIAYTVNFESGGDVWTLLVASLMFSCCYVILRSNSDKL